MNSQQEKRYAKLKTDLFYLLDREVTLQNYEFHVSGSTCNIYTVTIYPDEAIICCTCPDAKSWAKKYNCVCKHCLFVLFRVLKIFDRTNQPFFNTLMFSPDEIERITVSYSFLTTHLDDTLTSKELTNRYKTMTHSEREPQQTTIRLEENDLCGVCFLEFTEDTTDTYKVCPKCNKPAHDTCINKWIESGQKLCVYCRQKVWGSIATKDHYKNLGY